MALRLALALAAVLAAACGRDRPGGADAWVAERDTVGDTIVVRTVSGSVWGGPARLVERLSIGVLEGDEALMLGDIGAIAVDPAGAIYVVEWAPALKKFAPDGRYLATFGRVGSGPGEYRRPDGGLAVLPDGRVVLRDPGNGRLAVFSPDGVPLATWRISGGFSTSRRLYTDRAGNLYTLILLDDSGPSVTGWRMGLLRFGPDGTPGDSIEVPEWKHERAMLTAQKEGSSSMRDVPFSPTQHWAVSPGGYVVGGVSTAYRIDVLRPGQPLRIERTTRPVPVQGDEAADYRRAATAGFQRGFPGWTWNGPDIPSTKPPYRGLFTGEDGRIWVQLSAPGRRDPEADTASTNPGWHEPVIFDVFEPDGRYLGQVTTPDGFLRYPEPVFRGDTVWAGVEDADGVRYVKRFEVVRDSSPAGN